jgi:hypothetical protein
MRLFPFYLELRGSMAMAVGGVRRPAFTIGR